MLLTFDVENMLNSSVTLRLKIPASDLMWLFKVHHASVTMLAVTIDTPYSNAWFQNELLQMYWGIVSMGQDTRQIFNYRQKAISKINKPFVHCIRRNAEFNSKIVPSKIHQLRQKLLQKTVVLMTELVAALLTVHGSLSFLADVDHLFDPSGGSV